MLNANTISQTAALNKFYANFNQETPARPKKSVSAEAKNLIFNHVKACKGITRLQLIKRSERCKETVRLCLDELFEENKISRVAIAAQGKYTIYTYFEFGKEVKTLTINERIKDQVLSHVTEHKRATNKGLSKALSASYYRIKKVTELLAQEKKITIGLCPTSSGGTELVYRLLEAVK